MSSRTSAAARSAGDGVDDRMASSGSSCTDDANVSEEHRGGGRGSNAPRGIRTVVGAQHGAARVGGGLVERLRRAARGGRLLPCEIASAGLAPGAADGRHVIAVAAHALAALATCLTRLLGRELVRQPLGVRSLAALAGYLALLGEVHPGESAVALGLVGAGHGRGHVVVPPWRSPRSAALVPAGVHTANRAKPRARTLRGASPRAARRPSVGKVPSAALASRSPRRLRPQGPGALRDVPAAAVVVRDHLDEVAARARLDGRPRAERYQRAVAHLGDVVAEDRVPCEVTVDDALELAGCETGDGAELHPRSDGDPALAPRQTDLLDVEDVFVMSERALHAVRDGDTAARRGLHVAEGLRGAPTLRRGQVARIGLDVEDASRAQLRGPADRGGTTFDLRRARGIAGARPLAFEHSERSVLARRRDSFLA